MTPINGGHICAICTKTVIDYSSMTDTEMIAYINKYGMGCGTFRDDQLNRELIPHTKHNRFFYIPLLAALFFKPAQIKAQSVPDTVQLPCKQVSYDKLENKTVAIDEKPAPVYRFGTGNVTTTKCYKCFGIYWKKINFTLIKIREKCKPRR